MKPTKETLYAPLKSLDSLYLEVDQASTKMNRLAYDIFFKDFSVSEKL